MGKVETIREFAKYADLTQAASARVLELFGAFIIEKLQENEEAGVTIPGIGVIHNKVQAARKGRNPYTGENIEVPEKVVPAVRLLKSFRTAVIEAFPRD